MITILAEWNLGPWFFKISNLENNVMVFSYNENLNWSNIRFFSGKSLLHNKKLAKDYVDYMCIQMNSIDKEK